MNDLREVFSFGKYLIPGSIVIGYHIFLVLPLIGVTQEADFFSLGLYMPELIDYFGVIIGILGLGYTAGFILYIIYLNQEDKKLREETDFMKYLRENFKDLDYANRFAFYDLICYSEMEDMKGKDNTEKYISLIKTQWDYLNTAFVTGFYSPILATFTAFLYTFIVRPATGKAFLNRMISYVSSQNCDNEIDFFIHRLVLICLAFIIFFSIFLFCLTWKRAIRDCDIVTYKLISIFITILTLSIFIYYSTEYQIINICNIFYWLYYTSFFSGVLLLWHFIFKKRIQDNKEKINAYQKIILNRIDEKKIKQLYEVCFRK